MRVRQRKWKKFNRYVASIMDSQAVKTGIGRILIWNWKRRS